MKKVFQAKQCTVGEEISQRPALTSMVFVESQTDTGLTVYLPNRTEEDRALFHVQTAFL
jgi:hypothetical protein